MIAISLTPGLTEVTVVGGCRLFIPNLPARDVDTGTTAATTILTFGELNQYCQGQLIVPGDNSLSKRV